MSERPLIDPAIERYVLDVSLREAPILRELRDETARLPNAGMQIGPEEGQFMQLLVRLLGVRRYLEIGTFTGYSSLAVALALPDDGRVVACAVSAEYTAIAARYWERAGVRARVDLRLGRAVDTLDRAIAAGESYDLAFIDADKSAYDAYYEACLQLVRPGGAMLIDNVFWGGAVLDPSATDEDTRALRTLNAKIGTDERVEACMLPIRDGVTLVRRR